MSPILYTKFRYCHQLVKQIYNLISPLNVGDGLKAHDYLSISNNMALVHCTSQHLGYFPCRDPYYSYILSRNPPTKKTG